MSESKVNIVAVGDVQPNRNKPTTLFERVQDDLKWGDVRYCQLECTISDKGMLRTDVRNPAHRVSPRNIDALTSADFNVVSYAGNNNLDYGVEAFEDTLDRLRDQSIDYVGAGRNLDAAIAPLYTKINGLRVAWVNFCSILREGFEATVSRPGIAPLKIKTFYEPLENIYEQPGTPAKTVTFADSRDLEAALEVIRQARESADLVIGCFHWGVHFTHDLAMYQADIAYAAIDNGCDIILGTHPHCLQAIDLYRGKFIFYSLGNFAFEQPESIAQKGVGEYLSFYGIPLEQELSVHPHPRHCRDTIMLRIEADENGVSNASFLPVFFSNTAQPEVQEPGTDGYERIVHLLKNLCAETGVRIDATEREVKVLPEKTSPIDTRRVLRERKNSYPWLRKLATVVQ